MQIISTLRIAVCMLVLMSASGCVGTVIGAASDAVIEVAKVPFKVGGAVVDVVSGDEDEKDEKKAD